MAKRKYKSDKIFGRTVTYTVRSGRIWARVPSITSQFLGEGKTKAAARREVVAYLNAHPKYKKK